MSSSCFPRVKTEFFRAIMGQFSVGVGSTLQVASGRASIKSFVTD